MSAPIAITMGDPAGIGPEVVCKALAELGDPGNAGIRVIGALPILERANALCRTKLSFGEGGIPVDDLRNDGVDDAPAGEVSAAAGEAAYRYIVRAAELAQSGEIGCIVTAPINKAALHAAGHEFDGHTGLLSHLAGGIKPNMLLTSPTLSTIHVSAHVSLQEAIRHCTRERVLEVIKAGDAHFRRVGVAAPRIAVAALNPHAGEGGMFGSQDDDEVAPAVEAARTEGIDVVGPLSGDTVFARAHHGEFDLVVAQYHDQGHATVKLIAFDTAVNVTVGLPFDRCSVDHGTAFDIAWTGKADHTNMVAAIAYGRRLAAAH
ncbi:MAG: 4-hydroxythreonine-4-phosphate dehydrogenase PdxA [Alphaproteobacteria bacterium]|nr:4-hydroxythreonine-4-phosphate dehydrogenase PdxA [Alphaproteobacteria bacterium]